ncbi:YdeI/OmpD-associated family protein, partial [Microvirga sp. 3-52]|nr:YdeI/OmpD-associated family protein [Microvirga sp. 3-52]
KAGLKVEKKTEIIIPEELQSKFDEIPVFKTAFEALTPGRQRAYVLYFSQAKQSSTRTTRVERYMQHIFDGKGLNDK